ncbi:RNA polymerase sigma factor [Camelliibacillus cellulosilyticus]|uniref:RNA polymerase sigma factor n=1 Tax=Camelliibacillus cellulosilyticus TaxID=2174486 RepID=A0ABV9GNI3_9BACL
MALPVEQEFPESFTEAVTPFLSDLRRYCLSLKATVWDGEDLMQETLLKAFKSWKKARKSPTKAYLFRIASNTWIDDNRQRKLDEKTMENVGEFADLDAEASSDLSQSVSVLLKELSLTQRTALLLIEGYGFSARQAAQALGTTEGAVKAALHRARKKLKRVRLSSLETDDASVLAYVEAFHSGEPERIIQLYRKETGGQIMNAFGDCSVGLTKALSPVMTVQWLCAGKTRYALVSIIKNGKRFVVPFLQTECLGVLMMSETLDAMVLAA